MWQKMQERRGYRDQCSRMKAAILLEVALLIAIGIVYFGDGNPPRSGAVEVTGDGYIKWVDFNVSYEALCKAYEYDVKTYGEKIHLDWIELLAYVAARNGGEFGVGAVEDICVIAEKLLSGEITMKTATEDMKYYAYYKEAYDAVLGGLVGEYEMQEKEGGTYEKKYGLKGFSPIAKGFEYSDYDDFGVSRSYGYRRQHLGHDMMGQVGTPIRIEY